MQQIVRKLTFFNLIVVGEGNSPTLDRLGAPVGLKYSGACQLTILSFWVGYNMVSDLACLLISLCSHLLIHVLPGQVCPYRLNMLEMVLENGSSPTLNRLRVRTVRYSS